MAGRYEVSALVAEGPIFTLVRARDRIIGRDVSLRLVKAPFDGQRDFIDALDDAVRKVAPISHSNVERLIELDRADGQAYVVGEWTQAPILADRVRKLAPFSVPVAVAAALSVARGLDAFHKMGLVHGDIGPDTACLMADGEVRLQMGGLWEAYGASPTAGAIVLPSLAYAMAPEVGKGGMPSLQSDVYAAGVLLFELLTGRKPYVGDTPLATAMRHSTDPTPRVRDFNPSAPMVVDEIVAKAMDKDPAQRYANAGELMADLRLVQDALRFGRNLTWPLRPVTAPAPATKPSRKAAPAAKTTPRMSAARDEDDDPVEYGKVERDVPAWASLGLALVVCVAVSLLAVYFVLNLNRPRLVSVPGVAKLSLSDARAQMEKLKLTLRTADAEIPNPDVEMGHVIDTDPPAQTRVREGTNVTATISAGPEPKTPDLGGVTVDTARTRLEKMGLRLSESSVTVNKPGAKDGTIVDQDPKPNTKIEREGLVSVTVQDSSLPAPEIRRYEYTLNVDLTDLTERTRVKIDVEDVDGKRTVQNRRRSPGEQFTVTSRARGDQATFRIYYADRLVKTIVERSDGTPVETTP